MSDPRFFGATKAISIHQPWASLMAIGAKQYETRSWPTSHRGPLAIASSRAFTAANRKLVNQGYFKSTLYYAGFNLWEQFPLGAIVAVVDVVDCEQMTESSIFLMKQHEIAFGNYRPGRYAWKTCNVRRVIPPAPVKGMLGIWDIEKGLVRP